MNNPCSHIFPGGSYPGRGRSDVLHSVTAPPGAAVLPGPAGKASRTSRCCLPRAHGTMPAHPSPRAAPGEPAEQHGPPRGLQVVLFNCGKAPPSQHGSRRIRPGGSSAGPAEPQPLSAAIRAPGGPGSCWSPKTSRSPTTQPPRNGSKTLQEYQEKAISCRRDVSTASSDSAGEGYPFAGSGDTAVF